MGHKREEWRLPGQAVICPGCLLLKLPDAFYVNRSRNDGRSTYCKLCTAIKNERSRRIYLAIKRDNGMTRDEWRAKVTARVFTQAEKYQRWRTKDIEHARAVGRAHASNRRTALSRAGGTASKQKRQWRWDYFGGKCYVCGDPAEEMDHVKAVAVGGTGWPANLRPICRTCNRLKAEHPVNLLLSWANSP